MLQEKIKENQYYYRSVLCLHLFTEYFLKTSNHAKYINISVQLIATDKLEIVSVPVNVERSQLVIEAERAYKISLKRAFM